VIAGSGEEVPGGERLRSGFVITVATWNVLHRVHAENWGEVVAGRWPDESERITAVTAWLAGRAEQVIALQEVSGDQLASLRSGLASRTVHAFRYPRVPGLRRGACQLRDPGEYLPGRGTRQCSWATSTPTALQWSRAWVPASPWRACSRVACRPSWDFQCS
jgi:hypothetical protein